jgi:hypothetical protein
MFIILMFARKWVGGIACCGPHGIQPRQLHSIWPVARAWLRYSL